MDDSYRAEIRTQAQFNRIKAALNTLDSIRLAVFGTKGQSYILSGHEEIESHNTDEYIDEVKRRLIGYLNSNAVRLSTSSDICKRVKETVESALSGKSRRDEE